MPRRSIPWKGFGYLARDPFGARVVGHVDRDQPPAGVTKNHQTVKQLERNCAHHEQIDGRNPGLQLWLSLIAYNLGNLWRRLALPTQVGNWSLTSLQQRLVKTGGRLIQHARYYWLLLAEGHLTRRLFGGMLRRIAVLPSPAG